MTGSPIAYRYEGEGTFQALSSFCSRCDEEFVIGERYPMQVEEERSLRSHAHFFAQLTDTFLNLPDYRRCQFPSKDHLRAHLLIQAGHCVLTQHPCATKAEAERTRQLAKRMDDYAIVTVTDRVVSVYTAKSMSFAKMGHKAFQAAKDQMLAEMDTILGVSRGDVERRAGRAA